MSPSYKRCNFFQQDLEHYRYICILDSKRSNECIDFTMMCFFFFCVCQHVLEQKVNVIGTLGGQKYKISNSFQKRQEKPYKNNRKTGILRKTNFRPNRIFYMFKFVTKSVENAKICKTFVQIGQSRGVTRIRMGDYFYMKSVNNWQLYIILQVFRSKLSPEQCLKTLPLKEIINLNIMYK
ncbi:Uncharacterized protein FWK35_00009877 [Aphis craccivora]|uniref:Uncharacterized protein n=1 Tax=Aphis craccivora TaxID=307492 RepID=A0A6G0ZLW4_APHCR|nr:Uncharacterized protein FWK35_00009877 [Aphis craccivora]